MKKLLNILSVLLVLFLASGSVFAGMDDESVKVMEDYISILENFTLGVEKAVDKDEMVQTINTFTDNMWKIMPALKTMAKKYPEIKDGQNISEDFKPYYEKIDKIIKPKVMNAFGKVMEYTKHEEVSKANEEIMKVFDALEKIGENDDKEDEPQN